jgi:general secretion pathway protein G
MRRTTAGEAGYTLLELMIVVTIIAILATLAEPMWQESITRAREASLKQTLFTMRDVLDQYRADHG